MSLPKAVSVVYFGLLVGAGSTFIAGVLAGRTMQASSFGVFVALLAGVFIVTEIIDLGINPVTTRYATQAAASGNQKEYRAALNTAVHWRKIALLVATVAAAVLTLSGLFSLTTAAALFLAVVANTALSYQTTLLQIQERFRQLAITQSVVGLSRVGLIATLSATGSTSIPLYITGYALGPIAGALYAVANQAKPPKKQREISLEMRSSALRNLAWSTVTVLHLRIDQLLVLWLLGETASGHFGAAYQASTVLTYATLATTYVLAPRLAQANIPQLSKALRSNPLVVAVSLGGCITLAPIVSLLLPLIFGPSFAGAWVLPTTLLLFTGVGLFAGSIIPYGILLNQKRFGTLFLGALLGLAATTLCTYLFAGTYGVAAGGLGFAAGNAVLTACYWIGARTLLAARSS